MDEWPDWVRQLPVIDTLYPGGRGHLLASEHGQVVLWSFPSGATVPCHRHCPQIGVVICGSVELSLSHETRTLSAGESFSLADQQPHAATVAPGTLVIEVFADPDRHTATPQALR